MTVVDQTSIRTRILVLVFGSLMFVVSSMGLFAVYTAHQNNERFERSLRPFPEAKAIYAAAQRETQSGSAKMDITAMALMGLTLACGLFASRSIVRRMGELREAAQRMAAFDLESPVRIEADTELDHVAAALDHMRGDLRRVLSLSVEAASLERLAVGSD